MTLKTTTIQRGIAIDDGATRLVFDKVDGQLRVFRHYTNEEGNPKLKCVRVLGFPALLDLFQPPYGEPKMNSYLFDVKLFASIRIDAETPEQAEQMIREALDCASVNAGVWPNGDPILFEASVDGELDLVDE